MKRSLMLCALLGIMLVYVPEALCAPVLERCVLKTAQSSSSSGSLIVDYVVSPVVDTAVNILEGVSTALTGIDPKTIEGKKRLAENASNKDIQFELGFRYEEGYEVPKDYSIAFNYYRNSASMKNVSHNLGNSYAQNNLGLMYWEGRGVKQNKLEGFRWLYRSAVNGNPSAQYNLGEINANGDYVPKNMNEALRQYREAARQGHKRAQEALKKLGEKW